MGNQSPGGPMGVGRVEVVGHRPEPGVRWEPRVGEETLSLIEALEELDHTERQRIRTEAEAILRRSAPPLGPDATDTGLVVGNVQSGKTMSFTAVTALARDNGYAMVILITGTSRPLSSQSLERLKRDLRLATRDDRRWQHFHNPRRREAFHVMQGTVADWRDPEVPEAERQSLLITVMKHHQRLAQLADLLRGLDLNGLPVLVIDDEADQAGLNNLVRQGQESTTYQRLTQLRRLLPHHTYLQYTATPQAPLLINLIDMLSPRFAQVLMPGRDYVGGREFFVDRHDLVRIIPPAEIPTRATPLHEPPPTLLAAMRIFILGVAAGTYLEMGRRNRSMMVHPSQQTMQHAEYARWVRDIKQHWENLLSLDAGDPDRREFELELRESYNDLHSTVPDLPAFDALLSVFRRVTRRVQVTEVNAVGGRTPPVDWTGAYGHILVGGQAMDRGFTVNGLTVTYMPRGVGVGNADTIWQRARFFGYKGSYLGYCRIYLEMATRDAYRRYVEHEEDVRARLIEHSRTGHPLSDWKRAFFLDAALQPTRHSVLDLDYMQSAISDNWYSPAAPHDSEEAIESNRQVVSRFVDSLEFAPDGGHSERLPSHKHLVARDVSLQRAYEQLLIQVRITRPTDSQPFIGVLLQLREYLDRNPEAVCTVYRISPNYTRERTLDANDEIPQLFQGAYPVEHATRGTIYPGDRQIRADEGVSIQIHSLELVRGETRLVGVPVVAVWLPAETARTWLVQAEQR